MGNKQRRRRATRRELKRVADWLTMVRLPGDRSGAQFAVAQTVIRKAIHEESFEVAFAERMIADDAGISPNTARRALRALVKMEMLSLVEAGKGRAPTVWRVGRYGLLRAKLRCYEASAYEVEFPPSSGPARSLVGSEIGATLSPNSLQIISALAGDEEWMSADDLAYCTGLHPGTVRRLLRKLQFVDDKHMMVQSRLTMRTTDHPERRSSGTRLPRHRWVDDGGRGYKRVGAPKRWVTKQVQVWKLALGKEWGEWAPSPTLREIYELYPDRRTVVIDIPEMPTPDQFEALLDLIEANPGPFTVIVRSPQGDVDIPAKSSINTGEDHQSLIAQVIPGTRMRHLIDYALDDLFQRPVGEL